jgi:hypothetical protein
VAELAEEVDLRLHGRELLLRHGADRDALHRDGSSRPRVERLEDDTKRASPNLAPDALGAELLRDGARRARAAPPGVIHKTRVALVPQDARSGAYAEPGFVN